MKADIASQRHSELRAVAMWASSLFVVDQATKALADLAGERSFSDPLGNRHLLLGLRLFEAPSLQTVVSIAGAVAWAAVVLTLLWRRLLNAPIVGLTLGGMSGNLLDRVRLGLVRDWLVVGPTRWNIADLALLFAIPAVILVVWSSTSTSRREVTG